MLNNSVSQKTALLIFARSATAEAVAKPLSPCQKKRETAALYDKLNGRTRAIAQKTGLPVLLIDENQQQGDTFGVRFANAFQKVYDLGYENLIAIGNDSPQLTASLLIRAANALQKGQMPIGPSCDGGFYLLGLSAKDFDYNTFTSFSWQESSLYKEWLSFASERKLEACSLKPLHDIDSAADIRAHAAHWLLYIPSLRDFFVFFIKSCSGFFEQRLLFYKVFIQQGFNKGSPVSIS